MARARRHGFTLVELMIVVMILAIIAAALSLGPPTAQSERKVDLVAEAVAMALRFARSEAIRTGEPHKVMVLPSQQRVYASKPDLSSGQSTVDAYTLANPFDKRPYDFIVGELPGAQGVEITNADPPFSYVGLGAAKRPILFDRTGIVFFLEGGVRYRLLNAAVELAHGDSQRTVSISHVGRVTVQ